MHSTSVYAKSQDQKAEKKAAVEMMWLTPLNGFETTQGSRFEGRDECCCVLVLQQLQSTDQMAALTMVDLACRGPVSRVIAHFYVAIIMCETFRLLEMRLACSAEVQ